MKNRAGSQPDIVRDRNLAEQRVEGREFRREIGYGRGGEGMISSKKEDGKSRGK